MKVVFIFLVLSLFLISEVSDSRIYSYPKEKYSLEEALEMGFFYRKRVNDVNQLYEFNFSKFTFCSVRDNVRALAKYEDEKFFAVDLRLGTLGHYIISTGVAQENRFIISFTCAEEELHGFYQIYVED